MRRVARSIVALLAATMTAEAQELGNAAEGHRLAEQWCSACHLIAPGLSDKVSDAVPTFPAIARHSSTTALSLRAFLQTSHRTMPNFNVTDPQIDDLTAYILGLRSRQP